MKKLFYAMLMAVLFHCGAADAQIETLPPILNQYRVGQGFNVHYDGSVLVYEGKIDGDYDEDIVLLYQNDLSPEYKIVQWGNYKEHGNVSATVECIAESRVMVRFRYLEYSDKYSDNRVYYWDIPLDYIDPWGNVKRVYLPIRTEQHQNFGGCNAGFAIILLAFIPLLSKKI